MSKKGITTPLIQVAVLAVLFFGGMKLGRGLRFAEHLKPNTPTEKYLLIAGILLIILVVLAVHELGHLIAGLVQGFRFELFIVGPLGIKRENDQIKIYLNKNWGYYGGLAATSPVDDQPDNAKKFANLIIAGPIASVLFAIVCFALAYLMNNSTAVLFFAGGAMSIAIFLVTTLPSKTGMFFTDRKRYQRLVTPGKDQEVELAMLRLMGKFSKDQSFKNINVDDIHTLVADEHSFIKFYGLFNLICFQLEKTGMVDEAVTKAYETASDEMTKGMMEIFNKEIEQFKEKVSS